MLLGAPTGERSASAPCTASRTGAEADRRLFVRSCVRVQEIFLREHLPGWPWHPGEQERMEPHVRAEKGRQCAEAFRKWMRSDRTAEAAHYWGQLEAAVLAMAMAD